MWHCYERGHKPIRVGGKYQPDSKRKPDVVVISGKDYDPKRHRHPRAEHPDDNRPVLTLDEAVERFEVSPIIARFNDWVVTEHGVECLAHHYPIEKARLGEQDWVSHMMGHRWVDIEDFCLALGYALSHFGVYGKT